MDNHITGDGFSNVGLNILSGTPNDGRVQQLEQQAISFASSRTGSGAKRKRHVGYGADDSTQIEKAYVEQMLGIAQPNNNQRFQNIQADFSSRTRTNEGTSELPSAGPFGNRHQSVDVGAYNRGQLNEVNKKLGYKASDSQ